jgi:glycosyltransferase involved in cell wall biosynthesis
LVITGPVGWGNKTEAKRLQEIRTEGAAGLNGSRRIYHFEYVSLPMLVTLIRGARAVIFPSLYEGFGLPVLEAMACRVPVVTSDTSSLPEVAGDAALLVDPRDAGALVAALRRLVREPALAAELAGRGEERARRFTWARAAAAMEEVFAESLAG